MGRIEFHYTMSHESWPNRKQCELNAPSHQRLCRRRIGDLEELRQGVGVRAAEVNGRQQGVDHQMTIDDACCKLKSGY